MFPNHRSTASGVRTSADDGRRGARNPCRVEARPRQGTEGGHQLGAENTEHGTENQEWAEPGATRTAYLRTARLCLLHPLWFSRPTRYYVHPNDNASLPP
jgi:hypothetical protein